MFAYVGRIHNLKDLKDRRLMRNGHAVYQSEAGSFLRLIDLCISRNACSLWRRSARLSFEAKSSTLAM